MIQDNNVQKTTNIHSKYIQQIVLEAKAHNYSGKFTLSNIVKNAFDGYSQEKETYANRPVYFKLLTFSEIDTLKPNNTIKNEAYQKVMSIYGYPNRM